MSTLRLGSVASYQGKPSIPMAKPMTSPDIFAEAGLAESLHPLRLGLKSGCYRITYTPSRGLIYFSGTLRIDTSGGLTTISGDLYRFTRLMASLPITPELHLARLGIPIYGRSRYYSYLKGTDLKVRTAGFAISEVEITADEYVYAQPPAGAYSGTFTALPTRTVVMVLKPEKAPAGFSSTYLQGSLFVGGVEKGTVAIGWVSSFFRKATVEIDTLVGSVQPLAVPAIGGAGTESFKTAFATGGWDVAASYNQTNIPVPTGVTATTCWSDANLHQLMVANRKATTDLDREWHAHLIIVPGAMGCSRGKMYDSIDVPREGAMAYSDDGYPDDDSSWFGSAENQPARNVPRAFLRTAIHEIGHAFNLIHQFFAGEGGSDNSIMTTTPEVANMLRGPTTGEPGVFPDNISMEFNEHCRRDLIHLPDVAVRPGGISFLGASHASMPEADFDAVDGALELTLQPASSRISLGEPLGLKWQVTNKSKQILRIPKDLTPQGQHAFLSVRNPRGQLRIAPSFIVTTEHQRLIDLKPGKSLSGESRLFWSSNGFAFEEPGRHVVNLQIVWGVGQTAFGLKSAEEIWVDYPATARDNEMAATLLNPEVGKYVALGGSSHLAEAKARMTAAMEMTPEAADAAPTALRGFAGILPKR